MNKEVHTAQCLDLLNLLPNATHAHIDSPEGF